MKVLLVTYEHEANGLSLQIEPESEIEAKLLKQFWRFGKLQTGHPCGAKHGDIGYYLTAFRGVEAVEKVGR